MRYCAKSARQGNPCAFGISGLGQPIRQIPLSGTAEDEKARKLHRILDELQQKYGEQVIKKGSSPN
ncbi:MAG: hypothetical protein Fur0016_18150 [Anaerolineales bacterium]